MKYHTFAENPSHTYPVAILMKPSAFTLGELKKNYVTSLVSSGLGAESVIAYTLSYNAKKASVAHIKEYLGVLLPELKELAVKVLYVTDGDYFKVLAKVSKADPHHGYALPCGIKGYEDMVVVLGVNYQTLVYNPELKQKMDKSLDVVSQTILGTYVEPGVGIIHSAEYPKTQEEIQVFLDKLHAYPELTVDIEAFSLSHTQAGIASIAFAWDEHNGGAFVCDEYPMQHQYVIRAMLINFFMSYKGNLTYHNANYDVKVLIFNLFMQNAVLDIKGMLNGLEVLTKNIDDTKIIAYLATNTTAGNELGLKKLAQEFAGNWAVDEIKDVTKIPKDTLLQYNLVDTLCTWYVKKKYYPLMVKDNQEALYKDLMMPTVKLLLQTELVGMPINKARVNEIDDQLRKQQAEHINFISTHPLVQMMNTFVQTSAMEAANAKLKTKQHPLSKFSDVTFNPNSGKQLQYLLYDLMGLPVIDFTESKQPATGGDTLEKLIHHTKDQSYKDLIQAIIDNGEIAKILSTFIPAFHKAYNYRDMDSKLFGNFNIGGTVSGRLSSSSPNLQNLPSNSTYGKLIKTAFSAPKGWIFAGADFNSLEDMISALTTKDSNKLKVYLDGFDGHCLRAFAYFGDQMPDIEDNLASINSIKKKYPHFRQDSKVPTFALTYLGTWRTLVANLGLSEELAKSIESNYHKLYVESDEYTHRRIQQATKDGYVEVAFGLRVRTPLLGQVVYGSSSMPYAAAAEGRTAGNALGQSYGLLNNRAAVAFMKKVWDSPYRTEILPVGLIHDAIYLLISDDLDVVKFANDTLIQEMKWQELPEIQHDKVKLGANLDLFWPSWANGITLPNDASKEEIMNVVQEGINEYSLKKDKK